jgi:hypothetical protein
MWSPATAPHSLRRPESACFKALCLVESWGLCNDRESPHRSHCPHYPQSRASIVPQLIFLHCGKIAPLGLLCTSAKQPFGSGFIVVQFLYQGGTEMMASALFAVEKNGRGRSSRKGPICTNLVCRHGTRVRPKTNNQFGAGTLRHQCAHLYSVC